MAKDRNSFAKRQREMEKKRKAEQKRALRLRKKERTEESAETDAPGHDESAADDG
jgi:hypothetical protein